MLWGKGNSFPVECEARLPVKACTFMLERQTALFRSLVDKARLFLYHTQPLFLPRMRPSLYLRQQAGLLACWCLMYGMLRMPTEKSAARERTDYARQVMGMGDMSKVDTWREPDGVRVDKLIMRPSHDKYAQGCVIE